MRLRSALIVGCTSAALALSTLVPAKGAEHECVAGKATAASYTWNFKGEANTIFEDIQMDAQGAMYHADQLQTFARNPQVDWQVQADELTAMKAKINDIGDKLCRLETIRRALAPWQQREIDQIAVNTRLMADNAQDAILFGNGHSEDLWLPTYQTYVKNLNSLSQKLTTSVDNAVAFAGVSKEYLDLEHKLGVRASS